MYSKFLALPEEKQRTILSAAIAEFTAKGYKAASTDIIAGNAGISKGSLFLYFKSKKDLFLYAYNHAIKVALEEYFCSDVTDNRDILEKLKLAFVHKIHMTAKNPGVFEFALAALREKSPEILHNIDSFNAKSLENAFSLFFDNIDVTLFKDDIDPKRAIDIITWTTQSFAARYQATLPKHLDEFEFSELITELDEYLNILRKALYK